MKFGYVAFITFAVLSVFVSAINVGGDYIIHFVDIFWPTNAASSYFFTQSFFSTWSTENFGLYTALNIFSLPGYAFISFFYMVGIPAWIQEITIFSITQFLSLYFFYRIFIEFLLPKTHVLESNLIAIFASISITYNYSMIIDGWWDAIPSVFFMIGFGSAFIYYMMRFAKSYLEENTIKFLDLSLMFLFSALSVSANIPFALNLIYLILVFLLFSIFFFYNALRSAKKVLLLLILTFTIIILSNLWWVLPNIMYVFTVQSFSSAASGLENIGIYTSVVKGITPLTFFRILYGYIYIPFFTTYSGSLNNRIYHSLFILTFVPIFLIFTQIVVFVILRNSIRSRLGKTFVFFLVSLLPLAFILSGGLEIGNLIDKLFENGLISEMLRNPIVSFSIASVALLVIVSSVGLSNMFETIHLIAPKFVIHHFIRSVI